MIFRKGEKMEEKTIGQVLKLIREEQNLTLSDVQHWTKIQKRYIKAIEQDNFDYIPGSSQTRQFLAKYAAFLEIDVDSVLVAYDTDTPLLVHEVDDARSRTVSRRKRKGQHSQGLLPLFYLTMLAVIIAGFVIYTIWDYQQNQATIQASSTSNYSVLSSDRLIETSTSQHTVSTVQTEVSQTESVEISVSGQGNEAVANVAFTGNEIEIEISVNDTESWVSLSNTDLANGQLLSPSHPNAIVKLDKTLTSQTIVTLGMTDGVSIKVNKKSIDLSILSSQPATLIINFT